MKSKRNDINIADECKRLMNFHVMLFLKDGIKLDGIIQDMNDEGVLVLVGEDVFKNHLKIHLIDKIICIKIICIEDINLDFFHLLP